MTPALFLDDVRVRLRDRDVLVGVDLRVAPGECRALVGLNGAGKTTVLRVLLGMLRPSAGHVSLFGDDVATAPRAIWARVGHLVESPACYPELTARENIRCAARLHGADPRALETSTQRLAAALGLDPWLDVPVRRCSLGTRQKVGLASALAHEPELVVLDEPTNALDPLAVVAVREMVAEVTGRGGAVLLTSHHFDELARVADAVDVLHRGRVVATISPDGHDLEHAFFDTVLAADREQVAPTPRDDQVDRMDRVGPAIEKRS